MDLLKRSSYKYDLPQELIAQTPAAKRDMSRLLVMHRSDGALEHRHFSDIVDYINKGDCLVINETRVIPARLFGVNPRHAGAVETLLLKRVPTDNGDELWECLNKPGKKARPGDKLIFGDKLSAEVVEILEDGKRLIRFIADGIFIEILSEIGSMPLPPYITERLTDAERYQTVYSRVNGSAAAPTAGLHFTPELLDKLQAKGVHIERVLLHVGLGTFRPVKEDDLSGHIMHSEYMRVTPETAQNINRIRQNGGRIVAVGTTSVRTLETASDDSGVLHEYDGETSIFIHPPYKFKCVDALITNFHLPESTLIMLVSAFAGYDNTMNAYKKAVEERYRFFSFGDAMLIL